MAETFLTARPIDGHCTVVATPLHDALAHELAARGTHWHLERMRAADYRPTGYVLHSVAGTLVGVLVRCVADTRPDGMDSVHSRDWIVLPARGAVPRRAVSPLVHAVRTAAFRYARAPVTDARNRRAANLREARRPQLVDPRDATAFEALAFISP